MPGPTTFHNHSRKDSSLKSFGTNAQNQIWFYDLLEHQAPNSKKTYTLGSLVHVHLQSTGIVSLSGSYLGYCVSIVCLKKNWLFTYYSNSPGNTASYMPGGNDHLKGGNSACSLNQFSTQCPCYIQEDGAIGSVPPTQLHLCLPSSSQRSKGQSSFILVHRSANALDRFQPRLKGFVLDVGALVFVLIIMPQIQNNPCSNAMQSVEENKRKTQYTWNMVERQI